MHHMTLILFIIALLLTRPVGAVYDPLRVPNNTHGIHVADPNDIPKVKELVNSSGGSWGYVTLVIPENQRNPDIWQPIFTKMKRDRLIPIVRLATRVEGSAWIKPSLTDANVWASFLNALPWPTKNRYVVIFNEPNHAKEWGGQISPNEYADTLVAFSRALKEKSTDFLS